MQANKTTYRMSENIVCRKHTKMYALNKSVANFTFHKSLSSSSYFFYVYANVFFFCAFFAWFIISCHIYEYFCSRLNSPDEVKKTLEVKNIWNRKYHWKTHTHKKNLANTVASINPAIFFDQFFVWSHWSIRLS